MTACVSSERGIATERGGRVPQTHARGTSVLCLDLHKFGKTVAVAPDEVWWNSAAPLRSSAERCKRCSMRTADEWRGVRGEVLNLRGAVEHRGRTHGGTSVVCICVCFVASYEIS